MKRLLSILLFTPILGFSQYTTIPDQNFEQALIDLGLDNAIDGQVLTANISSVNLLYLSNKNISDLTGIEDFTALTELHCSSNQLTSIDFGNNVNLIWLECYDNQLTFLDVSENINLTTINCGYNQLTTLNIDDNDNLMWLDCMNNQLINLDVTNNHNLTHLYCDFNQLVNLDVSNNILLIELGCINNQLISLDISNNLYLSYLECYTNQLECLNLKNGNNINMSFNSINNPNLTCIEIDNVNWANQNWYNHVNIGTTFSANCNYNNSCYNFATSIEESSHSLILYPNPTNNLIQIEIENYYGSFEAELYDFTGKLLETTNKTSFSLADYPRGIYLLKLAYGDRVEQLKVVKE